MKRVGRRMRRTLLFFGLVASAVLLFGGASLLREAGQDWAEVQRQMAQTPGGAGYRLENEDGAVFAEMSTEERHIPVRLEEIDERFLADVIAVEDAGFFKHNGVRWNAVAGAAGRYFAREALRLVDFIFGTSRAPHGNVRGGSTITQQLIKNLLQNPPRTVRTKMREVLVALRLEHRLGKAMPVRQVKRTILQRYLNEIYAAPGLRGIRGAARVLLGSGRMQELDGTARVVLLSCVQAPAALREGRQRSSELLARTHTKLLAADRSVGPEPARRQLEQLAERLRERLAAFSRGPPVGPTHELHLSPTSQASHVATPAYAEALLRQGLPAHPRGLVSVRTCRLARLDRELNQRFLEALPQTPRDRRACTTVGAFLLIRISDGAVLSLGESGCGPGAEVFETRRQILSTFKPFLYARAIQELKLTPASVFVDRRITVRDRLGRPYAPGNHYPTFKGPVSLKTALQFSTNTVSLQLLQRMSVHSVINLSQALFRVRPGDRLRDRFHPDFALALGAAELSPAELGVGYLSLVTGGRKRGLRLRCDEPGPKAGRQLIDATAAAQVRDMLTAVVRWEGTAGFSPRAGPGLVIKELGGKSGTSERDSWFAGFSQDLLMIVWVGAATGQERLTAGLRAATIWRSLFALTTHDFHPRPLTHPDNLTRGYFCRRTGRKPGPHCRIESSLFAPGQEPAGVCPFPGAH